MSVTTRARGADATGRRRVRSASKGAAVAALSFSLSLSLSTLGSGCRRDASTHTPVEYVDIDLGATGVGATIKAPERAAVEAEQDGVRVTGGSDFDMYVQRGTVDLWALRCELASQRAPALLRFVESSEQRLVYEVAGPGTSSRYHFVLRDEIDGIPYYCRSRGDGAQQRTRLDNMIAACSEVRLRPTE